MGDLFVSVTTGLVDDGAGGGWSLIFHQGPVAPQVRKRALFVSFTSDENHLTQRSNENAAPTMGTKDGKQPSGVGESASEGERESTGRRGVD